LTLKKHSKYSAPNSIPSHDKPNAWMTHQTVQPWRVSTNNLSNLTGQDSTPPWKREAPTQRHPRIHCTTICLGLSKSLWRGHISNRGCALTSKHSRKSTHTKTTVIRWVKLIPTAKKRLFSCNTYVHFCSSSGWTSCATWKMCITISSKLRLELNSHLTSNKKMKRHLDSNLKKLNKITILYRMKI